MVALLGRRRGAPAADEQAGTLYRDLYTRILMQVEHNGNLVIGITSAIQGEGKSTIAARLAAALAGDRAPKALGLGAGEVLLLECNQGDSAGAREFGVAETPGLIQHLAGACSLDEAIKPTTTADLAVLPAGGSEPTFPILIRTGMGAVLDALRGRFAITLIDLPPTLNSTDAQVVAGLTDQLLFVVRAAATPSRLVAAALETLEPTSVLGIVLNDCQPDLPDWLDRRL